MSNDPAMSNLFFEESNRTERDHTLPRFYLRPVEQAHKTATEGRPIFEDVEFVEIIIPGNRGAVHDTMVRAEHRERWPREYAAFKAGQALPVEGTPLEEWPAVTRSQVEELRHFNIRTVEQLAALSDDALNRVVPMGGFSLREKAQRFLEHAASLAPMEALAAKHEADAAKLAAMEEQIRQLTEQLKAQSQDAAA